MKYKQILAFGDSITFGFELNGQLAPSDTGSQEFALFAKEQIETKEVSNYAYPALVGQHFNIPVYNFALPGTCNDRILRLLPEKVIEYPESLVLIGWTSNDRTEGFHTKYTKETGYLDDTGYAQTGVHVPLNETNQFLITNYLGDPDPYNNYKSHNSLLYSQLLLEKFSVDYLHIFMFKYFLNETPFQQQVFDQINKDKILAFPKYDHNKGFGSFCHWASDQGLPMGTYWHPLDQAHHLLANQIIEKLSH